jgi:hypothetical protein
MRRWAAPAVAALIASVPVATSPAAAQASAPDPVRVIKRQFKTDHGVRISETTRFYYGKKSTVSGSGFRTSGTLQFGPSGPVAANFTWWSIPRSNGENRVIRVGKNVYDDSAHYSGLVPDGRKWIHFPNNHRGSTGRDLAQDASLQPFNVYDGSLMKAVLKRSMSKPVSGGFLYRGTMTYKELVSRGTFINWTSGKPITGKTKGKVSWQLWTGRDGLPKRLITADSVGGLVKRSDTRYTGWGIRVVITAPPADEVIDEDDVKAYNRDRNTPAPQDENNT